jgi:hypothetical protein
MDAVGKVGQSEGLTKAECSKCPWTIETPVPGKAAHELMEHNAEEHQN